MIINWRYGYWNARTAEYSWIQSLSFLLACLFPFIIYCYRLLLSCTALPALVSGLQIDSREKKKKEQSPTSFLLSGSGEILIHMMVYHASYTAVALLTQHHLSPAVLSKCLFSVSHLKYCLAFCSPSPVFPLNSIILKTNASCRKKHHSCWEHHPL